MKKILKTKSHTKFIILLGVLYIFINTLFGTAFDTVTKYVNEINIEWYYYYGIGNGFGILIFILYLLTIKKFKTTLVLNNYYDYLIPVLRGIGFVPIPLIVFYSLERLDISIFTTILMTTPFFLYFWSIIIQKEKFKLSNIFLIFIGFCGVVIIVQPIFNTFTITIFVCFIVPLFNSLASILVSKYSKAAPSDTYVLFFMSPLVIISLIICLLNPTNLSMYSLFIICLGGTFLILAVLFFTLAFHIAGNYSRYISPFLYLQILWALLSGYFFFGETINILKIIGIGLVVFSGSLVLISINSATNKN